MCSACVQSSTKVVSPPSIPVPLLCIPTLILLLPFPLQIRSSITVHYLWSEMYIILWLLFWVIESAILSRGDRTLLSPQIVLMMNRTPRAPLAKTTFRAKQHLHPFTRYLKGDNVCYICSHCRHRLHLTS